MILFFNIRTRSSNIKNQFLDKMNNKRCISSAYITIDLCYRNVGDQVALKINLERTASNINQLKKKQLQ